ncbi:transposase [Candidatus Hadarchaeum sp.]|uniref:transposase n=1 Tax=Candidatus Hadarchaeum sp. TaxID=2883567 RepID=UPI00319DF9DF
MYRAETEEKTKERLEQLRERLGTAYLHIVAHWETRASALLAFLWYSKLIHRHRYTMNQLGRLTEE